MKNFWPYGGSSSRQMSVPKTPELKIDLDAFEISDKALDASLTSEIWDAVDWLGVRTDSAQLDIVRGLLFQALYGQIAYQQLVAHVEEKRRAAAKATSRLAEADSSHADADAASTAQGLNHEILRSTKRSTVADLEHVGKSHVRRKLVVPHRMWFDLDRVAAKNNQTLSECVRSLLFSVLRGEIAFREWQFAREVALLGTRPNAQD